MQLKKVYFIPLIFMHFVSLGQEHKDSVTYHANLYFLTASQNFQPHWQVSNKYGIFERIKQNEYAGLVGLDYNHSFNKQFYIISGIEFNLTNQSYLQQAFLNFNFNRLQLKIGVEAYTIGQYSEDLSLGSLFVSNNARPLPKIGIGFYDYSPVPLLTKYLEFKGAMNFGILNDDRSGYGGTDNPWYHEKFLYLRTKFLPLNLHAGINHSALSGGTTANGTEIPVDFWATFLGQSSSFVGDGEEINVAGAHFGLYDFGLNWKIKNASFQAYYQIPFEDGSSSQILNNGDKQLGLLVNLRPSSLVSSFNYEFINTTLQSGHGVPDAIIDGEIVDLLQVEDPDSFMLEHFDTVTVGFTNHQLKKYCEDELNYGYSYNGRDDLYNNYLYPMGLSYHYNTIGTSLVLSKHVMKGINGNFNDGYDYFFVSNRVKAHHVAFKGAISKSLTYRAKFTYSVNYGSYAGENKGRFEWGSKEDPAYYNSYYFKEGLNEFYTFLELNYSPFKRNSGYFITSVAYDFGEMYHNFGILFGFHCDGFILVGKKE